MDSKLEPSSVPRRRRYQFGLGTLLLLTIPVSLLAAALGGMLGRGGAGPNVPQVYFILMCIATPLGLLIAASVLRWGLRTFLPSHRREAGLEDEDVHGD